MDRLERRALRRLLALVPNGRPLRVLDIPSGYGRMSDEWASRALFVVSADRSDKILRAGLHGEAGPPRVCCDIRNLPFRDGAFDLACVVRLWHHFRDPQARASAFAELRRVTTGHLILTYYRTVPLHAAFRRVNRWWRRRVTIGMLDPARFAGEAAARSWALRREVAILPGLHAQTVALLAAEPAA